MPIDTVALNLAEQNNLISSITRIYFDTNLGRIYHMEKSWKVLDCQEPHALGPCASKRRQFLRNTLFLPEKLVLPENGAK